jgi:hypothetical protein
LLYKKHPVLYRQFIKTPFTPRINLVLLLHSICAGLILLKPSFYWLAGCIDLAGVATLSVYTNVKAFYTVPAFIRLCISFWCAPVVLVGALAAGSIRWRKFLFW